MKLFTVGPVEMYSDTLYVASKQLPYFRTKEFSDIVLDIQEKFLKLLKAPQEGKLILLTASGTGAMECAVMNGTCSKDKILIINGGGFGRRFCEICQIHHLNYECLNLKFGESLTEDKLMKFSGKGITKLLVNVHETSTGQLYDLQMIGNFCKENNISLIVDAVSSFLVDYIDMEKMNVDMIFTGSQKALALSPGLACIAINPKMERFIMENNVESLYFDLKPYLVNMKRGQTPFTPAVGVILELKDRLDNLYNYGIDFIVAEHKNKADYFRNEIIKLGLTLPNYPLSNGLTPIIFTNGKAYETFLEIKEKYDMMLTPNGGELADKVLRVGHMGNLTKEDYDNLIKCLKEVL